MRIAPATLLGLHGLEDSKVHRFEHRTWPRRLVVFRTDVGWNQCDACGREHRIWMTDDKTWKLLPPKFRKGRICVRCFRAAIAYAYLKPILHIVGVQDQMKAHQRGLA